MTTPRHATIANTQLNSPFISAAELATALTQDRTPRLIFVATGAAEPAILIANSLETSVATHFAGPGGGLRGRLPLPDPDAVRSWLRASGIDAGTDIVVYDDGNGSHAARAWWVLGWAGHDRVRILDGGSSAWQARNGDTDGSAPHIAAGDAEIPIRENGEQAVRHGVDTADIASAPDRYLLVDARGKSAFDGDGITPSHLPGAINSPASQWQDAQGLLLPHAQRKARAQALGLLEPGKPIVAYCGSGIAASYLIAATQDLGVDASLYAGSWSAWSASGA